MLLHVEARRTGRAFESLEGYAGWEGPREPDENLPSRWVANVARSLRVGIPSLAHPRERLYRELPLLLVDEGPARPAWDQASARLLETWARFNAYLDHWLSHTRGRVIGSYGLLSGGLGADLRVGSFFGPDWKMLRYQLGPDIWYNGYGNVDTSTQDYWLPWAPGVDISNVVTLKLLTEFHIIGEATPAFVFHPDRQSDQVEPFDELTLALAGVIRTQPIRLTVGYLRRYQAGGVYEGLILSGAI